MTISKILNFWFTKIKLNWFGSNLETDFSAKRRQLMLGSSTLVLFSETHRFWLLSFLNNQKERWFGQRLQRSLKQQDAWQEWIFISTQVKLWFNQHQHLVVRPSSLQAPQASSPGPTWREDSISNVAASWYWKLQNTQMTYWNQQQFGLDWGLKRIKKSSPKLSCSSLPFEVAQYLKS